MSRPPMRSLRELPAVVTRRRQGEYDVDMWGADSDWVDIFGVLTKPVLRVRLDGSDRLPDTGGAILVTNQRIGVAELVALSVGIRRVTGRLARPVGVPDTPYLAPLVRRFGMVQASGGEIRSVLADGQMVIVPLSGSIRRQAGTVTSELLAPALELGVPVFPVATVGGELTGSWRAYIDEPLPGPSSSRRSPLAAAELADRARAGVQMLLDDEFPTRWSGI
jgi:hypothetical protein